MALEIIVYSTNYCPYCVYAKELLKRKAIPFTEIKIDEDPVQREQMVTLSGRRTVPQIFINGQPIGGYDDLYALDKQGELDKLIKGNA